MKLYLAGPMTGIPEFNFPLFISAAADLRSQGHQVFSPAEKDLADGFDPLGSDKKTLAEYMSVDLPAVCLAEGIALLPGWQESKGAFLEFFVAKYLNKRIYGYYPPVGGARGNLVYLSTEFRRAFEDIK